MTALEFHLPMPPSGWKLYTGWGRQRHHSKVYGNWLNAAWGIMLEQVGSPLPRIAGPVAVSVQCETQARADIDNRIKPALDLLVMTRIIENDDSRCVRKVSAEWADVEGCVVRVEAA